MTTTSDIQNPCFAGVKELLVTTLGPASADAVSKLGEEFFSQLLLSLTQAIDPHLQDAVSGVINGGDSSTNTVSVHVSGKIPAHMRTIGLPVSLVSPRS